MEVLTQWIKKCVGIVIGGISLTNKPLLSEKAEKELEELQKKLDKECPETVRCNK